jgi:hypothetical protein
MHATSRRHIQPSASRPLCIDLLFIMKVLQQPFCVFLQYRKNRSESVILGLERSILDLSFPDRCVLSCPCPRFKLKKTLASLRSIIGENCGLFVAQTISPCSGVLVKLDLWRSLSPLRIISTNWFSCRAPRVIFTNLDPAMCKKLDCNPHRASDTYN